MKKAKILMTAIAVFAIVGGALAYKAHTKRLGNWFCSTTKTCDCTILASTTTDPRGTTLFCTDVAEDCCTIKHRVVPNFKEV